MLFAAEMFSGAGYEAVACGFDIPFDGYGGVKKESSPASALDGADYAVLPPVVSRDGKNVAAPLSEKKIPLGEVFSGGRLFFCGAFCPPTAARTRAYSESESFAVKNAVPTAEGALKVAMEETRACISSSSAAVLGFGRIGKVLAKDLLGLGASAEVFARRSESRALAEALGMAAHGFEALESEVGKYDCIFNTVPENVLPPRVLAKVKKGAVIIELASPPGGVCAGEASAAGVRLVPALGLPGRIMPKTAGKIIYETISEMIGKEGET